MEQGGGGYVEEGERAVEGAGCNILIKVGEVKYER